MIFICFDSLDRNLHVVTTKIKVLTLQSVICGLIGEGAC